MDRAVGGVKSLNIVKVVGDRTHLDHAVTVIGCKTLNLRTAV